MNSKLALIVCIFFAFMSGVVRLSADGVLTIDNSERISNKNDFILFTYKSDMPRCAIVDADCNGKTAFPLFVSLGKDNSTIKGMFWLALPGKNDQPNEPEFDFILDWKNELSLKFTILSGLDNETLKRMRQESFFRLSDLFDENGVLPPHIKKIVVEQKIPLSLDNTATEQTAINDLSISIFENLSSWVEGRISTNVQMDDKDQALLEKFSKGNSSLSDLCSMLLIVKKIGKKLETNADAIMKMAMEQNRKGQDAEIDKISEELSTSLDIKSEQKELLGWLNKYNDTFLFHIFYPAAYIPSYIESGKWQDAKKLLAEYQEKSGGDEIILNTITKEIEEHDNRGKKPYYLDDKFIAMDFDKIINDPKLKLKEKGELFEEKILEMSKGKQLTPELICQILQKSFVLSVSESKGRSPAPGILLTCPIALLPEESSSIDEITNYETGLVLFYSNEQNFITELFAKYPHCKKFYGNNRTSPISVIYKDLKNNPKAGKVLHDFLRDNQNDKDGIFLKLKEERKNFSIIESLFKILESRYGQF